MVKNGEKQVNTCSIYNGVRGVSFDNRQDRLCSRVSYFETSLILTGLRGN